jgi:hypothetical protein
MFISERKSFSIEISSLGVFRMPWDLSIAVVLILNYIKYWV